MTAKPHGQSPRHRPLEGASSKPVQLVDPAGGLDEFAPEAERSLLRIGPPEVPTKPNVVPDVSAGPVRQVEPLRPAWTHHANRVAFVVSSALIVVIAGILGLQPSGPLPPAGDRTQPAVDSAPVPVTADPPAISPPMNPIAQDESPGVEAPPPSQPVPAPTSIGNTAPSTTAQVAAGRSVSGAVSAPPVRTLAPSPGPPPGVVTIEAPAVVPPAATVESRADNATAFPLAPAPGPTSNPAPNSAPDRRRDE